MSTAAVLRLRRADVADVPVASAIIAAALAAYGLPSSPTDATRTFARSARVPSMTTSSRSSKAAPSESPASGLMEIPASDGFPSSSYDRTRAGEASAGIARGTRRPAAVAAHAWACATFGSACRVIHEACVHASSSARRSRSTNRSDTSARARCRQTPAATSCTSGRSESHRSSLQCGRTLSAGCTSGIPCHLAERARL